MHEPNEESQTKGSVEGSGHVSRLGYAQAGIGRFAISSRGRTLTIWSFELVWLQSSNVRRIAENENRKYRITDLALHLF